MQHLRSELRACELRFEMRDRELGTLEDEAEPRELPLDAPSAKPQRTSPSPPQTPRRSVANSPMPSPRNASNSSSHVCAPAPPSSQPPPNRRRLSRGASPKPVNDMALPIGRPSGALPSGPD